MSEAGAGNLPPGGTPAAGAGRAAVTRAPPPCSPLEALITGLVQAGFNVPGAPQNAGCGGKGQRGLEIKEFALPTPTPAAMGSGFDSGPATYQLSGLDQ